MPRPTITHEMKRAAATQVAKNLDCLDTNAALQVYRKLCPKDPLYPETDDPRIESVVAEINAVRSADTLEKGTELIEWWGWSGGFTAEDAARLIREFLPSV